MHFHEETRGCLPYLCDIRPEISLKICTADICSECIEIKVKKLKLSELRAIILMLETIRKVALGRDLLDERVEQYYRDEMSDKFSDAKFPFPIAYCFRSMGVELSYSRKWLKMLELYLANLQEREASLPPSVTIHLANLRRPSTGHWHTTCFGLLEAMREFATDNFLTRYLETLDSKIIKRAYAAFEKFGLSRNCRDGAFI
jgi:hypothetical protein